MEYFFGDLFVNDEMRHTIRVKASPNETIPVYELGNYYTNVESNRDITIVHEYKIERKLYETKDSEGNKYVLYLISEYSKNVDRTDYALAQSKQCNYETNSKIDYIAMMTDVDIPDFNNIGG